MDYQYSAIIIGKRDVGETDRIYTAFTQQSGKIKVLAKGVRKAQAKLAGALEPLTLVDLATARAQGMGKVTGVVVENNYNNLKQDLATVAVALRGVRLFDRLVDLEQPDEALFQLLKEFLETLDSLNGSAPVKSEVVSLAFTFKLLSSLGYHFEATRCVQCAGPLSSGDRNGWSPETGGVACGACVAKDTQARSISVNSIKQLRVFSQNSLNSLRRLGVDERDTRELGRIAVDFIAWVR
ncbi:DNA repair protein RecO [Patescibacteria group bacterium]|nr:MAG: DNA repair protein RecO [Patescibacteria group bacterium]